MDGSRKLPVVDLCPDFSPAVLEVLVTVNVLFMEPLQETTRVEMGETRGEGHATVNGADSLLNLPANSWRNLIAAGIRQFMQVISRHVFMHSMFSSSTWCMSMVRCFVRS